MKAKCIEVDGSNQRINWCCTCSWVWQRAAVLSPGVGKLFGLHAGVLGELVGPNLVGGGREENIGVDHIVCVRNLQRTHTQSAELQSLFSWRACVCVYGGCERRGDSQRCYPLDVTHREAGGLKGENCEHFHTSDGWKEQKCTSSRR